MTVLPSDMCSELDCLNILNDHFICTHDIDMSLSNIVGYD